MHFRDTIVALASGPARSPRAIIRVSGPGVADALAALGISGSVPVGASSGRLSRGPLAGLPLLIASYPSERSYTGEQAAEVLVPGNPFLIQRACALMTSAPGIRAAEPGEFTARAFLNQRVTLDEARTIADVIAARNEDELRAVRLCAGTAGARECHEWAEELGTLLALVEAGIDFTDQEDVVAIAPTELVRRLHALRDQVRTRLASASGEESPDGLLTVVLYGRANAGKSSLFNALLGRRRAVTHADAGTTTDLLREPLSPPLEGLALLDSPGLDGTPAGDALRSTALQGASLVLWCDEHMRFDPEDAPHTDAPVLRIATKSDRPHPPGSADLAVCALDGSHLAQLRALLHDRASTASRGRSCLLPRHRRVLAGLLAAVNHSLLTLETHRGQGPELSAADLRACLAALAPLTGRVETTDVLGRIFGTFCIGK